MLHVLTRTQHNTENREGSQGEDLGELGELLKFVNVQSLSVV